MSDHVWYVAYGSNLHAERFALYLAKSRDTSPPTDNRAHPIPHPVVFAGASKRWNGGGVAFLDLDTTSEEGSFCRAWRVTHSQFEDVLRQENGRAEVLPVDLTTVPEASGSILLDSWYGRLHRFADIDGEPAVTFSRSERPSPLAPADPSYLRVIAGGLADAWGFDRRVAADYLHRCPGNELGFSADELHDAIGGPITF